jgi:redox-sensitive bicupin YhaK (pirin superfamily)
MLSAKSRTTYRIKAGHSAYLVPSTGDVLVNGLRIKPLDGVIIQDEPWVIVEALTDADLLLIATAPPAML